MASAVAMNKPMAKDIWRAQGLPLAEGKVVHRSAFSAGPVMPCPYVIKPLNEGSSVGVHIVRSEEHTSELQSLMRISYAVFCLKKKMIQEEQHHLSQTAH